MPNPPTNVTPPPDLTYGYVDGRIILAIGDRSDAGRMPDPVPADGMTVTLTPANTILKVASPTPATVVKQPIPCGVDANGYLIDRQAARGVWLVTGTYKVTYSHPRATIPSHDIEVTTGHTEAAPLDLTTAMPPGGPVLTPSEYAELNGRLTILEAGGGGGVTDHGALTGLGDDDHTQYALADGTRGAFAAPLGADDNYVTDAEKAALHAHSNKAALDLVSGTNTGDQVLPTWSTISGKPAVVAAGATQADARTAIGAGTSSFSGAYADLTGKPTLGTAAATAATDYATAAQGALADSASQPGHAHAGADITSGTVAYARLPVGTAASTLAAGDDSRITGAAQKSANLSDLASASTARTNLGLTDSAVVGALPIPDPGSFYPTDTLTAALQLIGERERYGTGSPEGVVTAAVGTYYTDTAITNGAMRWAKKTGTGNTGWKVTHGDTGWRNVTASLSGIAAANTGTLSLRRIGDTVTWRFSNLLLSAGSDTLLLWAAIPTGFRGAAMVSLAVQRNNSQAYVNRIGLNVTGLGWLGEEPIGAVSTSTRPAIGLTGLTAPHATDDAWPTTLPGTAV